MSRGLGKRQKEILDKYKETGGFYLARLAKTESEYQAYYRAAVSLYKKGLIPWQQYAFGGGGKIWIGPRLSYRPPSVSV